MSLEDAMNNLATAMNRYADTMDRISNSNPTQIAVAAGGAAASTDAATTEKAKPGRKPKDKTEAAAPAAEEPAAEEDPFGEEGEEESAPELTAEVIRGLVMKVKDKNKDHALALIKKVGATTVSNIDPKQYPKVVELAAKLGVTL